MASEGDPPVEHSHSSKGESSASFLRAARGGNLDKVLELLRAGTDINTSNANGLNALHLASKEGHSDVVRELLKRKANVDAATRKGNTALHIASLAGQSLIVTILVENGANVNVQSLNGFTPLYMAAQENHEEVVRFLLNHGANQALSTEDGFTPLAVALQQGHDRVVALLLENDTKGKVRLPALHIAAKKDDTKAATLLLQNDHNADVTSKSGFTPLHIAAHYGNENVAQLLIEKGANVNYTARHNISPLHVATKWGRTNMVQLLLQHGAIIDSRTRDLLTPLHCAARSGHDQVVDMLLEKGAPISAKTKNGLAPLHMAAQGDHVDSARILLYHRAPVDDVTVDYLTPLHVAAHCGHVRVAKLLLDRNADPNARALNGFTPLHIACKKNRIKVVELLLKYNASIEATTESGLSPLHVASFMGAINIVIYLLQQGANPDVATVRGETPLHLAARANQTDVVRVLIRNGAKVDAQARELQTPLHIASRLGNTDIVVLLLQAGANANSATRDQYTPLHIAAKEGQDEVASILLDHGAEKSLLTKKGFTPLHLASKYGNVEVVRLLLEKGCPVDIEGKNQVTPLHVAAHYNNDKVAMLLLEHGASAKAAAKNGYTPLHIAAKKNQMDIAGTLLQYHADPNAKSRAGFTPLHLSSQEGHKDMAALLIENGSDVGAQANNGLTSMHLCAQEDHVPVAEELYKHHAEINPKTNAGYTPLHVACHFGQLNMVRFLVEHGANVGETTRANFTPLHQAAQQGHNNVVRYLLDHGASPNEKNAQGQTPLAIAQRLGYVSVVETLKTVTETTVITETTTVHEDKYKPQNPEAMNETMFSESEDEGAAAEHEAAAAHVKDFSDNLTQGLQEDSTGIHFIHTGEQLLNKSSELEAAKFAPDAYQDNLDELIKKAQTQPVHTAPIMNDSLMDKSIQNDNIPIGHNVAQPSKLLHKTFLISFLVDARGGAMRGCRHSGVRIIVPPRKASQPIRVTCRYLRKDKLAHPPPLSEGEELASRILEMAPAGAKFLGPVILEVPHFASLRDREREIVILRSDDGQHWKEHQLEATEDAVQEVLNESFDAEELAALDDLQTPRITRVLTNDFPMYFAVVTRVRQEVHCVGPEGGVIVSSVVPRVQAIFPDGSLTKTIKVSVQAQPVPQEMVTRLHGNRVAVSPIVTVEPRRRKFHKPITLCIPLPQSGNKAMLTQYSGQPGQEPPTLRLLCSITGGSAPAQWEDITGTTQLTFTGEEVSFTTTVSARFWLMDCQTPRDAARMAQEVYNEAISIPYMAKFAVFARRTFPVEGQLRVFCMTDDKEDKTLEKQEHFKLIAKSRDVEVLKGKHQFLEFAGNLVPVTKSGDQLSLYFQPFQENRLAFMVKTRNKDDADAETEGRLAFMREPKNRAESLPPQAPICTLAITLPEYTGEIPAPVVVKRDTTPFDQKYRGAMDKDLPDFVHQNILKGVGPDWQRLARVLEVPHRDIQQVRQKYPGKELPHTLKIWIHLKGTEANQEELDNALRRIGRDDIVRSILHGEPETLSYGSESPSSKRFEKYEKFEPAALEPSKKYTDLPPVAAVEPVVVTRHVVTHEESHIEEPQQAPSPSYKETEQLPIAEKSQTRWSEEAEPVTQTIPEEDEEAPVSEVRTVVRTERHVHDTDSGPMVEERTITTTYEDDVAVNENVVDRTVPLTEEEREKWEELHRLAESPSKKLEATHKLPEGVEQEVETEQHVENDGTIVTTTTMTSHYSETRSESPIEKTYEEEEALQASGPTDSTADSGTTQKKETAEEGFTNEDGSVVVSKKMTRVVTTTKTTLPGEGEAVAPESPTESLGSVKDRIAKFEQLKEGDRASVTSLASGGSADKEEESKRSSLERIPVDIVVTPVSPLPPGSDEEDEIAEAQEPLSPSVEEVSQAEVKSLDSYGEESPRVSEKHLEEEQEPLSPETDRSSTADLVSSDTESARRHKKREILEQSTTTTYGFTTQKEDRRHLQRGDEGEHPEDFAAEEEHGFVKETALESPAGQAPFHRTEVTSVRTEHHEELESPSAADKLKSFAKGAGKVLVAPVALAAAGAVAAYEKLKGESDEEEEPTKEQPEELHLEERQPSLEHPEDERLGTPESQKEDDQEEILRELEEEMEKAEAVKENPIPSKRTSIAEPVAEKESVSPAPIEDHWEVHREPDQVVETTTIRKVSMENPEVYEYEYPSPVEELPETEELAVPPVQAEEAESPEERNRREIFEQSTTTTIDFITTHEDRRHLQEGDKEKVPEEHAPVLLTGTPTEVSPHHVVETTKIVKETFDEGAEPHVLETTTISKEYYEEPSGKEAVEPEVEYEERFEEPHRHVETTTIKREYDEEFSEATSPVEDLSGGKVFVTKETFFEPETEHIPVHVVETTTITKEYTESPEHVSPVPIEEHIEVHREPDHIVETTTLRRYSVEEPEEHISHLKRAHEEEDIAGSPAKKTHYYEEEEPESPSAADKLKDFAKGAGKVLVAPVALAAAGALAAYEKLKDQSDEEEEEHHVKKTPEAEELHLEERLSLGEPGKLKEDVSTIVEVGTPESQREVEQEEVLRELEAEMDKEPVEEELESPVTQREIVPESPKELGLGGLEVPEEQLAPSDLASSEDETGPSEKRRPSSDIFYDKPESPVRDRDISPSAGLPEGLESPVVARKEYFHEEVPFSPSVSEKEELVSPVPGDESEKLIEEPAHIVETTISHRDYYEEPTEEEGPQPGVITEVVEEDIGSFHHVIETTQVQREYHEQPSDLTSTGSDHDSTLSIKSGQIVHEEPEQRHVVETTTVTKETFYDKNEEQEGEEEQEEHEQPHHIVETTMVSKEYYEEPSRVEEEEPLSPTRSEPIEEFIEVPHRVTFAPEVTKDEAEMVEEEDEHKTCHVVETTTTVKEIYFEEEPKEEELEHLPEEEDHHEKRHVYETTTVTKEVYYEEPEHGEAESSSPAPSPVEEQQPVTRAEYGDEVPSDEESTKDKLLGFAKGVGKVAAGIVAAPVALAAVGAAAAYDKLKGEDQEEDQFAQESPREELEKRRTSHGEPPSAAETPLRETETHEEFVSQEVQNLELPHEPVTESHVEKEPETHEEYVSREVEELELPHKQFHEEETYVLKSPVRYEKDSETQEELVSRENEELELPHGEVEQETHYKEQSETFEREEHLEVPERPEIEKNEEPAPDTVSRVAEPASPIEEEHLEVPERPEIEKNEEPEPAIVKGQIEDAISPVSVEEPIQLGETITEYHEEKLPSPASSQKSFEERPHIVETTVVTKEIFYEEPSSPTFSEKGPEEKENVVRDNAREVEIFTSTRDYYDQKEDLPEATDISEEHHKVHETVTTVKETFYEPSSRESPVPSEQESVIERGSFEEEHREPQRVVETTTTVREYFEEPSPSASEKEFPEEPSTEETIIVGEDNEPLRFVETSTTKKEYFEEPTESLEAPFEHHEPHRVIETMTVTKETYYEEPSTTHEPVTPEDEESTKEKLLSFGKKAGKIAAGIAIAPIALAAVGAQSAYEKLRGDEEEELPFWVDESAAPPSFPPPSYESVEQEDLRWKSLEQPQTVIEHAKEEETESSRDRGHLGLEVLGEQLAPSDLASPEDETGPSEERRPSKNIFYDKPESPVQDRVISPSAGLPEESSSPAASEKEDEGPSVLSALVDHEEPAKVIEHTIEVVSPEKESFEEEEDVIKPHHVVETTIVTKETFLEEPEEKTTEEETEARHVVETTITIKETDFEEPEDEEKDEQDLHRVVETFTTTQEYEQLEPAPEKSTETEEDLHESRYVTETKTVTKESFFDEPKEEVEGAEIPHHVVETTTTTRDIVEEPYISENTEENREKHIVEAIKTTTETYYDKESEDHPSHIKETVVVTKESVEEGESQVVETSTTVKETFFEEPESPTKEEHLETEPEYSIETTVSTKEIHFDEPKEAEHVIESAIYEPEAHHEEPSSPTVKERQFEEAEDYQQGLESPAESDEEATSPAKKKKGLGSRVFGFAKKAGMVVAAPVALAAKGASHAYDALKHKKEGQGEEVMHEGDERVYAFKGQEESGESAEASPETPRKTVEEIHGAPSTATFTTETEAEPHVIESTTYEDFSDAAAQAIKVDTVADEEEEDFEGDETHEIASTEYHPAHHEEQIHIEGKTEAPEEEKHVIESETYEDLSERADIPIKIDTVADEEEEAPEEEHREEFIEKEEEHVIPSETHDISAPAYSLDDEQPHVIESTTYEDLSDTAVPIKVDTVADEEEEAPEQMSEEIPSVEYHPSHHDEEIHIEGKIESPDEEEYVIESAPYEEYSTVEAVHEPEEFAERRPSVAKREVAEEEEERTSASPVSTDSRIVHEEVREEPVRVETELVEETAPVVSGYTAFGEPINTGLVISAPPSPTEEQELQREQLVSFQERELQEDEEESTKDKIFGFAKDFGQVAAGVVAAPIALAAVGAASAYDALTGQKEEGKTTEEHLMKESPISERESVHGEHFGKESSVKESLPESATPSLEEEEKSHAIESHEAPFEFSPEEERRLTQEIEETSELENRVEEAVRSPMEDVQHRFEQEMEGYEPDEKETHETLFEEQLEKLAEEQGRRSSEELASLAEEYPSETAALAEEVPTKYEEEKVLDEETSVEEHLMSPSQDVVVDIEIEEEEIGGRHHIIETTTIRREYDEELSSTESQKELAVEELPAEDAIYHHEIRDEEGHLVETTTITKEYYEEPEEEKESKEREEDESEGRHVVETKIVTKESFYDEPETRVEEGLEHERPPHIVETTTVTKEFYEEPEEKESPEVIEDRFEVHHEPTHVVETTIITKDYYEQPEEEEKAVEEQLETHHEPRHVVETTTITREYYDEAVSPAKEEFEHGLAEEGQEYSQRTEEELHHEKEPVHFTETTSITREYYEPEEKQPPVESEKAVEEQLEAHHEPRHVIETTTITREYFEEPEEQEQSSHKELEQLEETAPVVSGYTASGEPINTGLIISAPPSPAKSLTEEQKESHVPSYEQEHQYHGEEVPSDEESTKDRLLGFAKGVGKVAAGVVVAPVALAAVGAAAAYDKLKGEDHEEEDHEGHLVKEVYTGLPKVSEQQHLLEEPHVIESRETHFEESQRLVSPTTSPAEEERRFSQDIEKSSGLTSETRFEEEQVSHFKESPLEDVQHRFEEEMEGYVPETKETHETIFEEQLEKLAKETSLQSPTKESVKGSLSISDIASPTEEKHVELEEEEKTEAVRKPSLGDEFDKVMEEEWLIPEKLTTEEEVLSPGTKLEINEFVTDVVKEATAGAVIEAAEDLTPRSQRDINLEELALENVARVRYEQEDEDEDEPARHLQSPQKQSEESPSSDQDESRLIAGDDEWKVYDSTGQVVEEFSAQLTDKAIEEAGSDVTHAFTAPVPARRALITQESINEVSMEPETDYQSDLQEKLDILAGQKPDALPIVREEELDVIRESDGESEEHDPIAETASRLVDEVIDTVLEEQEGPKTVTSDLFYSATEKSTKDENYDTCLTSQEDTYESAQGWTSQDSEYTTATSEAPSRLSEMEERTEGTMTPQAAVSPVAVSPVDSDRQFVVDLDNEGRPRPIRSFTLDDETARSTPDVALQITIEEEEDDDEQKMPTSPSGVLLGPVMDVGRPISPVPPRKMQMEDDERAFEFVARTGDKELVSEMSIDVPEQEQASGDASDESARYTRHSSELSSESHADTVIHKEKDDDQLTSTFVSQAGSTDSLDAASAKSTGRVSEGSSLKAEEPAEPIEKDSPRSQDLSPEQQMSPEQISPERHRDLETEEGFVIYQGEGNEGELETVEEEPEDAESLNGGSGSSSANGTTHLGRKYVSSDNVSLTSLQEFERLEQLVANRGDSSLTASEIELYAHGRPRSMEGSLSSLAEFEKLEAEVHHQQANQSPQDEMMLSVVKEESEAEDMSVRDDDEDDAFSETEIKSRPVNEEDARAGTPQALSPSDSLERDIITNIAILETSTDSLEPSYQREHKPSSSDIMVDSLTEYEIVPRHDSTRDSLENIPMDKDSLLEGASQDLASQETHGLLSGDTVGTYQEHDDDDKDSLGGEMESMLRSYPTTLTTFITTTEQPDGSVQTISRRVETRVVDPVMSHVTFTGTESQERLNQLPLEQQIETVDQQGNVTRTLFKRQPPHSE